MSIKSLTRLFVSLSLTLGLVLTAGCAANPDPGGISPPPPPPTTSDVKIHVKTTAGKRWIKVDEIGVGLCKHAGRCPQSLTFRLQAANAFPANQELHITTAGGSATCLDPYPPYVLKKADPDVQVEFKQAACDNSTKAYWLYKVECKGPPGNDCGGTLPADPGVIIEGGPTP